VSGDTRKDVCLVIGAGEGVGQAIAHAFAAAGHPVCVTRRARNLPQLEALATDIRAKGGIRETTARVFTKVWEMACFAGFLAGREAARVMVPRGRGTILFTGATASLRGREGFSAFAAAKHGLRALAQSMARELGPEGIHVAHVICDGSIDGTFIRSRVRDTSDLLRDDLILKPHDIAQNYLWLHQQSRSAWSHEIDLRPWREQW